MNTATPKELNVEPLTFLKWVKENTADDYLAAMLSFLEENRAGLYIDDDWYEWEAIRHIFSAEGQSKDDSESGTSQSYSSEEGA